MGTYNFILLQMVLIVPQVICVDCFSFHNLCYQEMVFLVVTMVIYVANLQNNL